jgi:hypothetical protein
MASSSITQGPEIRKNGPFELMVIGPILILFPIYLYKFPRLNWFRKTVLRCKKLQTLILLLPDGISKVKNGTAIQILSLHFAFAGLWGLF